MISLGWEGEGHQNSEQRLGEQIDVFLNASVLGCSQDIGAFFLEYNNTPMNMLEDCGRMLLQWGRRRTNLVLVGVPELLW